MSQHVGARRGVGVRAEHYFVYGPSIKFRRVADITAHFPSYVFIFLRLCFCAVGMTCSGDLCFFFTVFPCPPLPHGESSCSPLLHRQHVALMFCFASVCSTLNPVLRDDLDSNRWSGRRLVTDVAATSRAIGRRPRLEEASKRTEVVFTRATAGARPSFIGRERPFSLEDARRLCLRFQNRTGEFSVKVWWRRCVGFQQLWSTVSLRVPWPPPSCS